jgi:hypothetical protein
MINEVGSDKDRRLIPVTKWDEYHSWPPIGGLRYLIFNGELNGFSYCVRRVGRKVLIDESRFFEWIDKQNDSEKLEIAKRA